MKIIAPLGLAACTLCTPALADEPMRAPDQVRFKKTTVMEFTQIEVSAELTRPAHSLILSRRGARFRSLIRSRADFRPELERSVDNL